MNFENSFSVDAPIDEVFAALMDVERVAPCMPGAEVLERVGDNAYKVGVKVKVGPISMLYRGQVEIVDRDDAAHQATMQVKAREARGQGTADASVHMTLADDGGATVAKMATDLSLSGRAASMGRGVIGDVAGKLIEEFAGNLAGMLGAKPEAVAAAPATEPAGDGTVSSATATAPPAESPRAESPRGEPPPPAAPAEPPPAPPQPGAPPQPSSLPVGKIAAGVVGSRLSDPRNLLITAGAFAAIFTAIGFRIGRRSAR